MNAYAVHLYFDQKSTELITNIWQATHEAGLTSELFEGAYRPHFSLMIGEIPDIAAMETQLAHYARVNAPFNINLSNIGVFPTDPGVVYLGLTVTSDLLAYHQDFHQQFTKQFAIQWAHYLPGHWVPHCTIGFKLAPSVVPAIVAMTQKLGAPIFNQPVQVTQIGVVQVPGAIECFTFDLQG